MCHQISACSAFSQIRLPVLLKKGSVWTLKMTVVTPATITEVSLNVTKTNLKHCAKVVEKLPCLVLVVLTTPETAAIFRTRLPCIITVNCQQGVVNIVRTHRTAKFKK